MNHEIASCVRWLAIVALGAITGLGCGGGGDGTGGSAGASNEGGGGAGGTGGAGGAGGTGGSTAATGGTGGAAGPSFAGVHEVLVAKGCTNGYCHGTGIAGLTITENADATYAELVDQTATGGACKPGGTTRVVPGDAENSLLWQKIAPGVSVCGEKMPPQQQSPLDAAQVETLRAWIDGGAAK